MGLPEFRRTLGVYLLAAAAVFAQGTTSRVIGNIEDQSGAAVPGANVTLKNEGTGVVFTTKTSASGTYAFEAVQTGTYELSVEATGFRRFSSHDNVVTVGQPSTINVKLEVGALTEKVEVAATAELVQTSSSGNLGTLVNGTEVRDLPIVGTRGRNPLDIVSFLPGVVTGGNTGGLVNVHGARDRAWNYTLDGVDMNEFTLGGGSTPPLKTNPDMLAEMRVLTGNTTAEFGRNSGGQVALVTKSGTNEVHGSGFWFYRTPRLNANEFENNQANIGKRQLVQHIFGGSIGGPIKKNKTFFFANVQGLHAWQSTIVDRTVYTETARQGIWRYVRGARTNPAGAANASVDAAGNVLAGVNIGTYNIVANDPQRLGLDPTTLAAAKEAPLPNNFRIGDGLNTAAYTYATGLSERQHDQVFKVDHIVSNNHAVYFRMAWGSQDTNCDSVNGGLAIFPGTPCLVNTVREPRNLAFNWRWTPTPRVTNEFVIGHSQYAFLFQQPESLDKISLNGTPVAVTNQYQFGNNRTAKNLQFVDNLAYFRGSHIIKFGANIRLQKELDNRGSVAGLNANEEVDFSTSTNTVDPATFNLPADIQTANDRPALQSSINFLLGRVGYMRRGFIAQGDKFTVGTFRFDARWPETDLYVQDTWKAHRNLTVEMGLRWEGRFPPSSGGGPILVPNQPIVAGAPASTSVQWVPGDLFKKQLKNFGPSFGFSWDPFGSGKTAIRGNYRVAFDRISTFLLASQVFPNLPGQAIAVNNTDFGQSGGRLRNLPALNPPSTKPSDLTTPTAYATTTQNVIDPNIKTPTTQQWSFGIQRQVWRDFLVDVTYVGRRGYHLLGGYDVNQDIIFQNGFVDAFKVVQAGGDSPLINNLLRADSRLNAGETGSQMLRRLFTSQLQQNAVASVASSIATRTQNGRSIPSLSLNNPYFFQPFPQYLNAIRVFDSNDFSTYHALELQVTKRMSHGVLAHFAYTYSKALDTRSWDPSNSTVSTGSVQSASSTPFDIYNRKLNYGISDIDRPHVFQSTWVMELPFGRGKRFAGNANGVVDRVIGGWEVSGLFRWMSGHPFTVYSGVNTFSNVVSSLAQCTCTTPIGQTYFDTPSGLVWFFNQSDRSQFSLPAAGSNGNVPRNFFRTSPYFDVDMSLLKRIAITEKVKMELRADATNVSNTVSFDNPTATVTSSIFGRINNTLTSASRKIQLGAKIHF